MRGLCIEQLAAEMRTDPYPASCATSSMNVSTANVVCELPTTRHQSTGTPVLVVESSTEMLGIE
jgi:hypothetical protein